MYQMFYGCINLITIDVSEWDTSRVTNMSCMFYVCNKIKVLDLSNWNTNKVINMSYMFQGCNNLTTIYVSKYNEETGTGWTTSSVTNSDSMFANCTKLVGGNGTTYNGNYTDATYARIDTPETPGYFTNITDKNTENLVN